MWVHLLELDLVRGNRNSEAIEDKETGACGALVDGTNVPVSELALVLLRHLVVR